MNDSPRPPRDEALDAALDAALRRVLQAPGMPAGFRERLRAAIVRAPQLDRERLRRELEREQREGMAALREGYVRMSRDAFAAFVGIAIVFGAAAAVWLPEIAQRLDLDTSQLVAIGCAGAAVGYAAWLARRPLLGRVMRWMG